MDAASGVILAGVHRWGDTGFDRLLPPPLMPIAHTPLICHVLSWLRRGGVTSAGICANSTSRLVRHLLSDGSAIGMELCYYEDWAPRGPAGCVRDIAEILPVDRLVVTEGTILPDCDLGDLLEAHVASGAALTVVSSRESRRPHEAQRRLAPVGIYVIERAALQHVAETGYQDVKEVLVPNLHQAGVPVVTHSLPRACPRVTDEASYLSLNAWVVEQMVQGGAEPEGYRRVPGGLIHESAHVASSAQFLGPFLIGPRTVVLDGATVVGPATVGADGMIGADAIVSRSVLWDRCQIGRSAHVDRCVLGDGVEVDPGAIRFCTALRSAPRSSNGRFLRHRARRYQHSSSRSRTLAAQRVAGGLAQE